MENVDGALMTHLIQSMQKQPVATRQLKRRAAFANVLDQCSVGAHVLLAAAAAAAAASTAATANSIEQVERALDQKVVKVLTAVS